MKAIVNHAYGTPDDLRLDDVDTPRPGPGEVLVRVRAAGVDPGVWHHVTGLPWLGRLGFGLRRPRQVVPGLDLAGVVEAVGDRVTGFAPGDEVYGNGRGSFAEYTVAPVATLARKPAALTFAEAAAMPISATTALDAVRGAGRVRPGQRVLVLGAGGGVGCFAVQVAKREGAVVTGVCSAGKADLVRSLGADDVVDYAREDVLARGPVHDVVVDTAGNRATRELRRAAVPGGTVVFVGGEGAGGRLFGGFDRQLLAAARSPLAGHRLVSLYSRVRAEALADLTSLVEGGGLRPVLDRTYPLAAAAEAVRHVAGGHTRGKVVLTT
ncbi:MAG: NAD(P)-dependent alcohol dehydrogenase [Kineosporiaceae bacterium]